MTPATLAIGAGGGRTDPNPPAAVSWSRTTAQASEGAKPWLTSGAR